MTRMAVFCLEIVWESLFFITSALCSSALCSSSRALCVWVWTWVRLDLSVSQRLGGANKLGKKKTRRTKANVPCYDTFVTNVCSLCFIKYFNTRVVLNDHINRLEIWGHVCTTTMGNLNPPVRKLQLVCSVSQSIKVSL